MIQLMVKKEKKGLYLYPGIIQLLDQLSDLCDGPSDIVSAALLNFAKQDQDTQDEILMDYKKRVLQMKRGDDPEILADVIVSGSEADAAVPPKKRRRNHAG